MEVKILGDEADADLETQRGFLKHRAQVYVTEASGRIYVQPKEAGVFFFSGLVLIFGHLVLKLRPGGGRGGGAETQKHKLTTNQEPPASDPQEWRSVRDRGRSSTDPDPPAAHSAIVNP